MRHLELYLLSISYFTSEESTHRKTEHASSADELSQLCMLV